ncbi:TetR/AcrR family transcriptional regulator [Pseudomonas yamanorum]|uniref:TetR/AcrR family transcriptional regulator n=1 Tax=Pseudomonas yamanorum TaxID=515393 RepID=A0A7Y8F9E0_9PSED|nr:TetR/AcrR family transcriptional regulator [Pseudomonas yamanorum]NWE39053.1 TetR/AcrR family transcriptional regulator [Pseudomonas yamanorum]NWE74895.1 TetR/AcrR family transcriptional regulator [Pseudomonas yamanorum]
MSEQLSPKAAEIVAHARLLLAAGGYNSFSYADISQRVGISKASIHHHFPSKAELVRNVVIRYREEAREGMAHLAQQLGDPLAEINAYVDYWSSCILDGTSSFCICAMLAAELPMIPSEIADEVRGHFEDLTTWLTSVIEKGQATRQFHVAGEPAVEAMALMATVHGAMLAARAFGAPETFRTIVQPTIQRLIRVH